MTTKSKLLRMDNVGIVVESLDEAISFSRAWPEARRASHGRWRMAGRVTGLGRQRVEIAMMSPRCHSRLEISRFLTLPIIADHRNAP